MSNQTRTRILFLGTPEFAAGILQKLLDEKADVVGIVTAPDKPAGRGLQVQSSAVKQLAEKHKLKIFQPEKLKNQEFLDEIKELNPDLGVVVAFRMMPEVLWSMPKLGTINLHASLLPAYRGAAPINRAVMAGEIKTGISTFLLRQEIDTGDLLMQEEMEIGENETAGSLYNRMMEQGAELMWKTIQGLMDGNIKPIPQDETKVSSAPKIYREDCKINPLKTASEIHNQVRGLNPYPGAFLEWHGKNFKIHHTKKSELTSVMENAGKLISENNQLYLVCHDEKLEILEIQPEGKRKMTAREFLAGNKTD
jgi:methionyl-tRNA formyltransferase